MHRQTDIECKHELFVPLRQSRETLPWAEAFETNKTKSGMRAVLFCLEFDIDACWYSEEGSKRVWICTPQVGIKICHHFERRLQ